MANRLAKKSRGSDRKIAYHIKSKSLCSLINKLSNQIRIYRDIKLADFVVIELKSEQSGLHLPSVNLIN